MGSVLVKGVLGVCVLGLVVQGVVAPARAGDGADAPEPPVEQKRSAPKRPDASEPSTGAAAGSGDVNASVALSSVPSSTAGIGDRGFFTFDEHGLNDRMTAKVNVANGNLLLSATDLSIGGTGIDAGVTRSFNSLSTDADPNGFGPGWSGGEVPSTRLEFPTSTQVTFVGSSGNRTRFDKSGSTYTRAAPGIKAKLTFDSGASTYRLRWNDKRLHVFNSAGQLERMEDRQGNQVTFAYDGSGVLDFVTDTQGRQIDFTYAGGLIEQVDDVAGGRTYDYDYAQFAGDPTWRLASFAVADYATDPDDVNLDVDTSYDYDADGRLTSVTDPMGNVTEFGYLSGTRQVASVTRVTDVAGAPDPSTGYTYLAGRGDCPIQSVSRSEVDAERTDVTDVTKYCVDAHHRVDRTEDAKGHRRASTYTPNSNVVTFNDSGSTPAYQYGWDTGDDNLLLTASLAEDDRVNVG